ncbi:MAG: hypothetical protein D3913_16200 [Candidatus Electrothrix sp. LOE1_4_5]|nr:hypothetical protein [Candidatus Electrothrix gigas]
MPLSMLTESALLLVQLRVALLPAVMDVGAADRETVGAGAGSVPPAVTVSVVVPPAVLEAGSAESVTAGVEADSDTLSVSVSVAVSVEQPNKLNTVKIMNSSSIFFTGNLKAML